MPSFLNVRLGLVSVSALPTKLPSAPPAPPADTRPARAATVAGFRAPWIGTMTLRHVERSSRWSSDIDASVTTASGVDLRSRESVSARSQAYARLRWAMRGWIALSLNGFAPVPSRPSRCVRHAIGTALALARKTCGSAGANSPGQTLAPTKLPPHLGQPQHAPVMQLARRVGRTRKGNTAAKGVQGEHAPG